MLIAVAGCSKNTASTHPTPSTSSPSSTATPTATPPVVLSLQWSYQLTRITNTDSFDGVAVDSAGNVFVADVAKDRLLKLDSKGKLLASWGSKGSAPGRFNSILPDQGNETARGLVLALAPNGNLYVADPGNSRIQEFDVQGRFIRQWGGAGSAGGQFVRIFALAIDRNGIIYAVDDRARDYTVKTFDQSGKYLSNWGPKEGQQDQLDESVGIPAVSAGGDIYFPSFARDLVLKFSTAGAFEASFPPAAPPGSPGGFLHAGDVGIGTNGDVFVVDTGGARIQEYAPQGPFVRSLAGPAAGPGHLVKPQEVVFDALGNVYVFDDSTYRLLKFSPPA